MIWLALGCHRADVEVVDVEDLGPVEQTEAVKGRDGGYSVTFGSRSVWLYGDSILAFAGEDGSSWRDNSWGWTDDDDASDGVTGFSEPVDGRGAPGEFFPETADEAAYNVAHAGEDCAEEPCGAREILWPMDAVETDAGVLLFYVKIHGEPGEWNFFPRGFGVAQWTDFDAGPFRPEPGVVEGDPTLLFGPDEPAFGDAATLHDGLVYAWGRDDDEGGKRERLGRVAPEDVQDRAAWTFWDGSGWSSDVADAVTVFDGASQMKVWWDPGLDTWLALYANEPWNEIVVRTAPAPEGPWSKAMHVADTEAPEGGGWAYCGLAHPEYTDGDAIFATYYRGTGDWQGEIRGLRIRLERR